MWKAVWKNLKKMATEFANDPAVLVAFGIVIFTSIAFPLAVAYAFRLWKRICVAWRSPDYAEKEVPSTSRSTLGRFNSDVLRGLSRAPREEEDEDEDQIQQPEDSDEEEEDNTNPHPKKQNASSVKPSPAPSRPKPFSKIELLKQSEGGQTPPDSQPQTPEPTTQSLMGKKKKTQEEEETVKALRTLSEAGLHGKLATAQLRAKTHKMEEKMTADEKEKERRIKSEQLSSIFAMMQAQGSKFGVQDRDELEEQLKLYAV